MSVDQYQRALNTLDKDIAYLEKKKAAADKKSADEQKKATSINISKNASASIRKSKMNEMLRHHTASNKAAAESADLQKKIAEKRVKRNEANTRLQLESVRGKMLLPIWHNLTKKQVMEFSPIIANKKAMTTASMTAQEIAVELANLLPNHGGTNQWPN